VIKIRDRFGFDNILMELRPGTRIRSYRGVSLPGRLFPESCAAKRSVIDSGLVGVSDGRGDHGV
jgi:hypothetical protein